MQLFYAKLMKKEKIFRDLETAKEWIESQVPDDNSWTQENDIYRYGIGTVQEFEPEYIS